MNILTKFQLPAISPPAQSPLSPAPFTRIKSTSGDSFQTWKCTVREVLHEISFFKAQCLSNCKCSIYLQKWFKKKKNLQLRIHESYHFERDSVDLFGSVVDDDSLRAVLFKQSVSIRRHFRSRRRKRRHFCGIMKSCLKTTISYTLLGYSVLWCHESSSTRLFNHGFTYL